MSESRIYTKMGDDGSTGLLFGGRVSKDSLLMAVVGTIDECVATMGLARADCSDSAIYTSILAVQRDLFVAGADLVANPHARDRLVPGISLVTSGMVADLEQLIDDRMAAKPLRPVFVVPGANLVSAALDMARTHARRAERCFVAYVRGASPKEAKYINKEVGIYLNRVSDLLYVLARQAAGGKEEPASHEGVARTTSVG